MLLPSANGQSRAKAIEYAYLSDSSYSYLMIPEYRANLRDELIRLLEYESRGQVMSNRIGTLFHESFALNRPAVSSILISAGNSKDEKSLTEQLRQETNLGISYVKAMPRYARACGLMEFNSTKLTPLGQHVLAHDPTLALPQTQWLMHYHLSAPHGPGPRFWHDLMMAMPLWAQPFGNAEVRAEVGRSTQAKGGRALAERSISSTATVFLGSYIKSDALESLGILHEDKGKYKLETPEPPPPGVVGYALAHYWAGQYGAQESLGLEGLAEPNGFAGLFFMNAFHLNRALRQLERQGILELWMATPPYQVTRPPAPEALIDGLYDTN